MTSPEVDTYWMVKMLALVGAQHPNPEIARALDSIATEIQRREDELKDCRSSAAAREEAFDYELKETLDRIDYWGDCNE